MRVSRLMRAERLMLTHFSQRYPKIPGEMENESQGRVEAEEKKSIDSTGVAFDLMKLRLPDLEWVPRLKGPSRWLFPGGEETDEDSVM
mmetsp:Transcript_10648/g.20413  ORF Transcript_10648/g.20413 Transcript_10648/m.20413 type:complete len:88 (+) Transcript_10648:189-452(+)